ncbi:Mitochondrial F1-F0 ATP synthase subunit like protein [Plasmodiophora brassicae]
MGVMDKTLKDLGSNLSKDKAVSGFGRFVKWYSTKYVETNSFTPVIHVCILVGTVGYSIEYFTKGDHHKQAKHH